ncbi:MAG: hypothetical protein H8D23_17050 [Candidatus Brocadiales bacterium]|nr:hypothetical protein [Candidatus Brocadiales bacterium]
MCKIVSGVSLFIAMLLFAFSYEGNSASAKEASGKSECVQGSVISRKKVDSCTVRCHVNYMAYENKYDAIGKVEVFRHSSHSFEQDLDCTSCHDNSEVNTEGHGKLTIKKENCLECHHVDLKESECKRCHLEIDENSMKYKESEFVHGFTVESDVDCGLCHVKDSNASLKNEEINCVKCHHTTPDLDCVKCHENDLGRYHDAVSEKADSLSWSISFQHSQHPEQELACKECHSISHELESGIDEYKQNCSKCHHISMEKSGCFECHKEPSGFLMGTTVLNDAGSVPDMMSKVVKCEDCHKYNKNSMKFKGVEEYCVECHNRDYGKLYNAWTKTIEDRLEGFKIRVQLLVENGMKITDKDTDKEVKKEEQIDMGIFLEKTGKAVDLITRYGTHNFNLTMSVLDNLEEGLETFK